MHFPMAIVSIHFSFCFFTTFVEQLICRTLLNKCPAYCIAMSIGTSPIYPNFVVIETFNGHFIISTWHYADPFFFPSPRRWKSSSQTEELNVCCQEKTRIESCLFNYQTLVKHLYKTVKSLPNRHKFFFIL